VNLGGMTSAEASMSRQLYNLARIVRDGAFRTLP
jgi:hypothetical protein